MRNIFFSIILLVSFCSHLLASDALDEILIIDPGPPQVGCSGDLITLGTSPLVSGGTAPYSITWHVLSDTSDHSGLSNPYIEQPTFTLTSNITYSVLVEDNAGNICSSQVSIVLLEARAGLDQTFCSNTQAVVLGENVIPDTNVSYSWNILGDPGNTTGLDNGNIAQPLASPSLTTSYELTVSHTNGCSDKDTVLVTVGFNNADAGTDLSSCINTATTIGAGGNPGTYTYYWTDPYDFLDDINAPNPVLTADYIPDTNPFDLYLTAISPEGCLKIDTLSITIDNIPDLSNRITAYCGTPILVGEDISDDVGNTYSWSVTGDPGNTTDILSPTSRTTTILGQGNYTVTVTNSLGCSATHDINVMDSCTPDPGDCIVKANYCMAQGDSVFIGIDTVGALDFTWSPTFDLSDSDANETWASPLFSTTYTLTVTYPNYVCAYQFFINIMPTYTKGSDESICQSSTVQIGGNGLPGWSYSWSPIDNLSDPNVARPDFTATSETGIFSYVVIGTHPSFVCEIIDTVQITVVDDSAEAGIDLDYCAGSSITLGAPSKANTIYTWSGPGLSNNAIAQPIATPSGTITYTLNTSNTVTGCFDTDMVTLTEISDITADATGPSIEICNGGGVQLGGVDMSPMGYTYSWTPTSGLSDPNSANPIASPLINTTYTLTVQTPGAGCYDVDTVLVTVNANTAPVADAGIDQSDCEGINVTIGSPAVGGLSYLWTPSTGLSADNVSQPTATIGSLPQEYTLEVTDGAGCIAYDQVMVSPIIYMVDAGIDQDVCSMDSIQIGEIPEAGFTYIWTPAIGLSSHVIANPKASNTTTRTYTLTKLNISSGCFVTDDITLTVVALPDNDAGTDQSICDTPVSIGPAVPNPGYAYSWSPTTGLSDPNIANPFVDPTGVSAPIVYTLSVNDIATGCSNTGMVTITPEVYNAVYDTSINICSDSVTIGMNSETSHTYMWSPTTGLSSATASNPKALPASTTTYTVTVTNSITACMKTATVEVLVESVGSLGLSDITVCSDSNTIIGITDHETIANFDMWDWSPSGDLSADNIPAPTFLNPQLTTTFTVQARHIATGCVVEEIFTVNVDDQSGVSADAGTDVVICPGSTTIIGTTAIPGLRYEWSPVIGMDDPTLAQPMVSPSSTIVYTISVFDPLTNCKAIDQVTITVDDMGVSAGDDFTACKNAVVNLSGTDLGPGYTYNWSPSYGMNDPTLPNPSVVITSPTTFSLEVTETATGCTVTDQIVVSMTSESAPTQAAGIDQTICNGESIVLGPQDDGASTYLWSPSTDLDDPNIANPVATPSATTTYNLLVSTGTCIAQSEVTITVLDDFTADAGTDQSICTGSSIVIGTASIAGLNYSWFPTSGLDNPNTAQPTANPSTSTLYTVTVEDMDGCKKQDQITVTVDEIPVATPGSNTSICIDEQVQLGSNALSGFTYTWSPVSGLNNSSISNPIASPSVTTTYTLTTTDNLSGCSDNADVTITVSDCLFVCPTLDSLVLSESAICTDELFDLEVYRSHNIASLGLHYSPVSGGLLTPSQIYNGEATTIESFIPIDQSIVINELTYWGADTLELWNTGADTIDISTWWVCSRFNYSQLSMLNVESGSLVLMPGNFVVLTGFAFDDLSADVGLYNTNDFANSNAMVDFVQYGLGGIGRESVAVTKGIWTAGNFVPRVSNSGDVMSYDGTGNNPSDWASYNSGTYGQSNTNESPNVSTSYGNVSLPSNMTGSPISYYLYAALGTGDDLITPCSLLVSSVISVNPNPSIMASADVSICEGDTLMISASGGTSYSWSPNLNIDDTGSANPNVYPNATTTYVVNGTDANGCSNADSIVVTVHPVPDLTTTNSGICNGESIDLATLVTDGNGLTGSLTYFETLLDAEGDMNAIASVVSPVATATYFIKKTTGTIPACSDIASVNIIVNTPPDLVGNDISVCVGSFVDLSARVSDVNGVPEPIIFYPTQLDADNETNALGGTFVNPGATTEYFARKNSQAPATCYDIESVTITVIPFPNLVTTNDTICFGSSANLDTMVVDLNPTPGTYTYFNNLSDALGNINAIPAVVSPLDTSWYYVKKTTSTTPPCETIDSIKVYVKSCMFDIALKKTLSPSQSTQTNPGDTVSFDITVYNQGIVTAYDIRVTDYLDGNTILADPDWMPSGLNATRTIDDIAVGDSVIIPINVQVSPSFMGTSILNSAEVSFATNIDGRLINIEDIDSAPDNTNGNDTGGTVNDPTQDDRIDDDGTIDEDDHDVEDIEVIQTFDLALAHTFSPAEPLSYLPGDTVSLNVTLTNEGTLNAYDIEITLYDVFGLDYLDGGWSELGSNRTFAIPSLGAGANLTLTVRYTVNPHYTAQSIIQNAEISFATETDGSGTNTMDEDSTADSIESNGLSEDDFNSLNIPVTQGFDLALRKTLSTGQSGVIYPGDTVYFDIQVFNQGIEDAYDIVVTDYLAGDVSLVSPSWTLNGGNAEFTVAQLDIGTDTIISIGIQISETFTANQFINTAEISFATDVNDSAVLKDDQDSDFDNISNNDLGGTVNVPGEDDEIDDRGIGDEDDQDPEDVIVCNIQISDLPTNPTCFGGTDGSIDITISGGTGPFGYQWADGFGFNEDLNDLTSGSYTVTVTDANGCEATSTITVDDPAIFTFDVSTSDADCGLVDGSIAVIIQGSTPTDFDWDNDLYDGQSMLSGLTAGTYSVTVTDILGCQNDTLITINSSSGLSVGSDVSDISCKSSNDGEIALLTIGGTMPYDFDWSDNSFDGMDTLNNLAPAIYSLTVTDLNGCTFVSSFNLTEPDTIQVDTAVQRLACAGDGNGIIDLNVSGGTLPYTYTWNNGLPAQQDQTGLSAGTFVYTITDANSCVYIDSVIIEDPIDFLVTADTNSPVCEGDTLQINAMNGVTYSWTGPNGFVSTDSVLVFSMASPDLSGTYTLISSNQNACRDTLDIIAEVYPVTGTAVLVDSIAICNINLGSNENVIDLNDLIISGDMSGVWGDIDVSGALVGSIFTASSSMADLTYQFSYTIPGAGSSGSLCGDNVYIAKVRVNGCGFDLQLDKSTVVSGDLGDTVTFSLSVSNQGDADAHDVLIRDHLPSGFIFDGTLNPGWTLVSQMAEYTFIDSIPAGQSASVNIVLLIDENHQATSITNTAEIVFASSTSGGSGISDVDSNVDNFAGSVMEDDEGAVEIQLTQTFDLALDVGFIDGQALLLSTNDPVVYEVIVHNEGSLDAYDVDISFNYPIDLVLNAGTSPGWTDLGNTATYTFGSSIPAGSSDTIQIGFTLISGSADIEAVINAQIDDASSFSGGMTSPDEDSVPGNDDNTEDDYDEISIAIDQTYDLALTLTASVDSVNAGDTVTFTLTITNQSTLPADDVTLVQYLPSDLVFDGSLNPGWTTGSNSRYYFVYTGNIGVGGSATAQIRLIVGSNVLEGIDINTSAEIVSGSFEVAGVLLSDNDGIFDDISSNDGTPIDDAINDPLDEDNHDIASLYIRTGGCGSIVVNDILVTDESCLGNNASILIDIINPSDYNYNWSPNIGTSGINDNERSVLTAGRYNITISEISNPMCIAEVMVDVTYACYPPLDTMQVYIPENGTITVCMDSTQVTLPKNAATVIFCNDGSGTNPPAVIGSTTMDPMCIQYDAFNDFVGAFPELLCVVHCTDDIIPICDTTLIEVKVLPRVDLVKVQISAGETTAVCLGIDALQIISPPSQSAVCDPGDPASVAVAGWDGTCVNLSPALSFSGVSMDTICLISCYDDDPNLCDTTYLCVEVIVNNCPDYFSDSLMIQTGTSMDDLLDIVVDAPYVDFESNYSLTVNGNPYSGTLTPTEFDTSRYYPVQFIPGGGFSGPYEVELWNVEGTDYMGIVNDLFDLVDSMNVWDPIGNWVYNANKGYIETDNLTANYGSIFISQVGGASTNVIMIDDEFDPLKTIIQVPAGLSELVIPEICPDTLTVAFTAPSPSEIYDTVFVQNTESLCLDISELTSDPVSIQNLCPDESGENALITINGTDPCLSIDGLVIGNDTACIVMCDEYGFCDTTTIYIYARDTAVGPPIVQDDTLQLFRNQFANIPILINDDTVSAITSLDIIGQPLNGDAFLNPDNTIRFEPDLDYCSETETQVIQYMVCNIDGCSRGLIQIQVLCDELAVNNGFSPNRDGVNDAFYIDAALLYPNNVLRVFNRWGAQVFKRGGYQNDWEGTWDGQDLPDGVYWYVFETGEGQQFSGYVVLYRN